MKKSSDIRLYAWDDPSVGSSKMKKLGLGTFNNKEFLKREVFEYDPEVRRWFTTGDHDDQSLNGRGIIVDEGIAIGDDRSTGGAIMSNFLRCGSFIDSARFSLAGIDPISNREVFKIDAARGTIPCRKK
jgi:hypothetical protein